MPANRQSVRRLTDSSGGTPSATDVVVDVPAYSESTLANQLATIIRKVNEVIDVLGHDPRR